MNLRQYDGVIIPTGSREPERRGERRFHSLSSLMLEAVRRQTFVDWPVTFIDPDKLARAGFYYLKREDHVQCAFCGGIVGFWDKGDVPEEEHKKHFPNCPFITGAITGNVPATTSPETNEGRLYRLLNQFYDFKVANTKPPLPTTYQADSTCVASGGQVAYPLLNTPVSRLRTFAEWPKETGVEAEMLSEAGFFYTGRSDFVQCFHCAGGLFAWRRGDDPLAEHKRSYPFCSFVRTKRQEVGDTEYCTTNTATPLRKNTLSNEEAELLLQHPLAKRVLDLGLSPTSVREALKLYLETRGVLCKTVTEALELVFDYDERQRQTSTRESVHDGIALPQPGPQVRRTA